MHFRRSLGAAGRLRKVEVQAPTKLDRCLPAESKNLSERIAGEQLANHRVVYNSLMHLCALCKVGIECLPETLQRFLPTLRIAQPPKSVRPSPVAW